ncbi:aggregation-promoting factor C-terminal-like domain-containing protein [Marisediminicola senii]|uniref:aggregation-promoting factor C-terminal-like domain-containing protein n=1 Tax=Marisediminicola senii TaxID=2711233 RepID=UPI001F453C1A|nr:lytic transglycosylase domain-containing protein [Marisediminicola senii]
MFRPRSAPARKLRRSAALPVFASFAALSFVLVSVTSPMAQTEVAVAAVMSEVEALPTQAYAIDATYETQVVRDEYGVTAKPIPIPEPVVVPEPAPAPSASSSSGSGSGSAAAPAAPRPAAPAPAAGVPDPGSAQAIAYEMVVARGWGDAEFSCLVSLWKKESGWNTFAENKSSGAYGIPQSLPGSKMATAGADWATNPATQITWGLGYITARYGTPCGAWNHSIAKNWY